MPVVKGEQSARPTATPAPAPVAKPTPDTGFRSANLTPPARPAPVSPGAAKTAAEPAAPNVAPAPLEKPVPVLQQHGFQGGINTFNQRVQSVHDTYTKAYGVPPSPGLTFDLATSKVDTADFNRMFTVPQNPLAAKNRGIVNTHPADDTLVVRHDGMVEANNPVAARLLANERTTVPTGQAAPPARPLETFQSLQAKHPWVAMGMLPLDSGVASKFWDAVKYAQEHPGATQPLTVGGESLDQYKQENLIGESLVGARPGENPGLAGTTATASDLYARQTVGRNVSTVKGAQDQLKRLAPEFFTDSTGKPLPSSGFVNQDWAKAIGKYQSSAQYFRQQTARLAHDNHFGGNTGAFIHAWEAKQAAIKKQPFLASFLQHQPLSFFDYRTHGAAVLALVSGDRKGWGWADIPTLGLGALVHGAGVALSEVVGTVDTAKQDAAFVSAYMQSMTPEGTSFAPGGRGMTEPEARARAFKVLRDKPSWARVIDPNYDVGKHSVEAALAPYANAAVDLWLGAPKLTGERIMAGDLGAVKASRYFNAKTELAFNALRKGRVGDASASLEGGLGAERLNTVLEDAVKSGEVDLAQYRHHASELYANGRTMVGDQAVDGAMLRSLRNRDLPTPGKAGRAAKQIHAKVRSVTDQFENTIRVRTQQGATSHAVNFISSVRQLTARVAPAGERRYIFDERLPEDVYNWARTQLKASPGEAAQFRDQLIRLRSSNDVQGITDLGDRMRAAFMQAHPKAELAPNPVESLGPELESESRSYLSFPAAIEQRAAKINAALNKVGKAHRQTVVGGSPVPMIPGVFAGVPGFGESLAFKHAVADTTRRVVGGGGVFPVDKEARALVDDFLRNNPARIRDVGVAREAAEAGETRWITGQKQTDPLSFRTGDAQVVVKGDKVKRAVALKAAGGYLRRNLSSDALRAYQASSKDNLQPLVNMILRGREWRGVLGVSNPAEAEAAAEGLFNRYKEIEEAGRTAGVADPLNEALDVLIKNKGHHADAALGKWIDKNGLDMPVRDGLVERSQWDDRMQSWIGTLMTANKWNRRQLFDHVFYGTSKDLVAHGWTAHDAIPVAADLAKAQTVYHMLDFSNMLQVEQNLRWLSYFATKHRLYWTWILKTGARRPGLANVVGDAQQHLVNGNLDMTVAGHRLQIPAARLFWVNAKEYPQTSPLVQFAAEAGKGAVEGHGTQALSDAFGSLTSTSGNLLTRDDQAEMLGTKLLLVSTGHLPATSNAVTFGMSPTSKRQFQAQVNEYSAMFRAEHGDWPNEQDAVKHVLLGATAQESWRTNLFLPVLPDTGKSPRLSKLLTDYGRIVNPAKKRAFLDQHPEVGLQFGVSQDPAVYLHNNQLWDKFNSAYTQVQAQRKVIYQQILKGGFTPEISKQMSSLSAAWSKKIDQLKLEDAQTWQGTAEFPKGKVSDGQVVTAGPWGTALEGDPFAARAFIHQSFPKIGQQPLNAHTVGARIVELQKESARLRAADTPAKLAALGYPDTQHVKDRLAQINQIIAPYFAYPKDAPAKLQSAYYSRFVVPYIQERDKRTAALTTAPQDQQDALRSEFRAWKDEHDHPVYMTVAGRKIKFPSVVQIGWAKLPDDQRHLGLAQAVTGDWAHIASYEKTLLGVEVKPDVSKGWAAFADTVRDYSKTPTNTPLVQQQKVGLAKQIDKVYPGFFKDFLFAQQPKIERFKYTNLYKQMPDRSAFDQYVAGPASALAKTIKQNGHRSYYEKYWRNYVETDVVPWLDSQPALKAELANYGPDFLNTLPG